jgi:peptidoglycan/xylan/chitin deacetylase (PgdA/CDA1 family)
MSVAILTYHSLDDSGSVISVTPQMFAAQMQSLARSGKRVVKLDEVPHLLERGESAVVITFDDGFRNFLDHAAPVLLQHNFPATVFLVTAHCGRDNGWPTQPKDVALQPLLTWDEVKSLHAAGIQFGAHSQSHPFLTQLSPDAAEAEMADSKRTVEAALGEPVEVFAYPYGACNTPVRELARRHFRVACGVQLGYAARNSDRLELERLDMYYWRNQPDISDLFAARTRAAVHVRGALRAARRLVMR